MTMPRVIVTVRLSMTFTEKKEDNNIPIEFIDEEFMKFKK